MPIKGLSDRGESFPQIGTIRKGAKKTDSAPGKDLTYFRVELDEREEDARNKILDIYGAEPQEIRIVFPFAEVWRCFDSWLEAYTAGRMVARSDGEKFIYKLNAQTNAVEVLNGEPFVPYKNEPVGYYTDREGRQQPIMCRPVGRLKVVIPELHRLVYFVVLTGSKHDIGNISAQLEALSRINNGSIMGVPMVLKRRPKPISCPKPDGTRARYIKWMLSIEADPRWVEAKMLALDAGAMPDVKLLSNPPEIEEEGTEEDLKETEFDHPSEEIREGEIQDGEIEEPGLMSLESAENEVGSDGKRYGDCTNKELQGKLIGITKKLRLPDLPQEERTELEFKRDACLEILNSRVK
jgi:hypothetical protein